MEIVEARRRYRELRRELELLERELSMRGVGFKDLLGVSHVGVRMRTKTGQVEWAYMIARQRFIRFRRDHAAELVVLEAGGLNRPIVKSA
jgi:hypothetical protein